MTIELFSSRIHAFIGESIGESIDSRSEVFIDPGSEKKDDIDENKSWCALYYIQARKAFPKLYVQLRMLPTITWTLRANAVH